MVVSLRKVDILHPAGHYVYKGKKFRPPPLEKILVAPLVQEIFNQKQASMSWSPKVG